VEVVLAARPVLIAQISDLHITRPGVLAYDRVDTAAALLRSIDTLNAISPEPDLVVISGDIADSALPEEYEHARTLLGALQIPFAVIPRQPRSPDAIAKDLPRSILWAGRQRAQFNDERPRSRYCVDRFHRARRAAWRTRCSDPRLA
jgi:Calcineurin-like phosphoesterase